jgi:hypothetical protein
MQPDLIKVARENIFKLLDEVDYQGDKDFFTEELVKAISLMSIFELLKDAPEDKRTPIVNKLNEKKMDEAMELIKTTFTDDQKRTSFNKCVIETLEKYLADLNGNADPIYIEKGKAVVSGLKK